MESLTPAPSEGGVPRAGAPAPAGAALRAGVAPPPFATITIVGLGLIGGSIALGLRECWPACRIVGVDRQAVLSHALGSSAIDRGVASMAEAPASDLVILAAPVSQNVRLLEEVAARVEETTLVTDVGGTKRDIVAAAREVASSLAFVGGHPIGGGERGGFGFARPDLFVNRPWIFTPDDRAPAARVERLFVLARALGARPTRMDAERHDRLMAYLSHLTQLTATALMHVTGGQVSADGLRLAGRGLVDTTRLASSPANVWTEICAANSDLIGEALDQLIETLTTMRAHLNDTTTIEAIFHDAARWRADLLKTGL